MIDVRLESPDQPDVVQLIADLDAYQDTLYPPESRHSLDLAALCQPEVLFAVARDDETGEAVGCGAVVLRADHGEVKRMYVDPEARGQGVARQLLQHLEARATAAGCTCLMLETGPRQPEAIALYESSGFVQRGRFGSYPDDPLSVFMHKALTPG